VLFPTFTFGIFFLVLFALVWLVNGSNDWRKIVLLIGSWIFYGAWDVRFVALLIASGVLNWGTARLIARAGQTHRRALIVIGVVVNLAILTFSTRSARSCGRSAGSATCR
jgi:D-alanyl-lipoteichoic acid acyltransferase DltB (MBOAT superfamily)